MTHSISGSLNLLKTAHTDTKSYMTLGTSMTIQNCIGNDTLGLYAVHLKQENRVFKGYVIQYGYYVIAGVLASVVQNSLDISALQFWIPVALGVLYYISVPYIHKLAWGKEV